AALRAIACSGAQAEQRPDQTPAGETPEVPYEPKKPAAQPTVATANGAETPAAGGQREQLGGATVVKTVPAPSSEVKAAPEEAPAPPVQPKQSFNPQAVAFFNRAVESSNKGDVTSAEKDLKDATTFDSKMDYA